MRKVKNALGADKGKNEKLLALAQSDLTADLRLRPQRLEYSHAYRTVSKS